MLIYFIQVGNLAINIFESITAGVDGMYLANSPGPNPFAKLSDGAAGMALIAELCDHFVFVGGGHERADFMDVVGQRFLASKAGEAARRLTK